MRMRLGLAMGFAAGYVAGSAAGRERYEQIRTGFKQAMSRPEAAKARELIDRTTTKAREAIEDRKDRKIVLDGARMVHSEPLP